MITPYQKEHNITVFEELTAESRITMPDFRTIFREYSTVWGADICICTTQKEACFWMHVLNTIYQKKQGQWMCIGVRLYRRIGTQ